MQINLDLRPLIFMTTAIFWLLAVVMILMGKAQAAVKGTREWAMGNFITGIGILLFSFYGNIPIFFSIVLSNSLIVLGICYLLSGIWALKEKPMNYLIFLGLPLFTLIQSFVFTNIFTLIEIRKILFTLLVMTGMLMLAFETYIPSRKPLLIAMRIVVISSTLYAFVMLLRLITVFIHPASRPIESSPINMGIWVFTAVLQISNSIGFLLMFLYKQSMQLQSSLNGMQRFFSIMAHDLRSPIGTLSMIAAELNNNPDRSQKDQKVLIESMKNSAANTFNLLENLLEWGSNILGDLHPQPVGFNLTEVLIEEYELAKSQALTKQIKVEENMLVGIFAFADVKMCHTIARNLLSNAIKFTPEGGTIKISAEPNNREAIFVVSDTGVGISQQLIKQLTNAIPVSSSPGTKGEQGFGLGLSFCQTLVEKNHGDMIIQSEVDKGTTIRVKLPLFHELDELASRS